MNPRWLHHSFVLLSLLVLSCGPQAEPPDETAEQQVDLKNLGAAPPRLPRGPEERWVTLITGDRVRVSSAGAGPVNVVPGAGRESMRFLIQAEGPNTYVIPADAAPWIEEARLDRGLFNVRALVRFHYDDARRADLPLIVTHAQPLRSTATSSLVSAGATVGASFSSIGATGLRLAKRDSGKFWQDLSGPRAGLRTQTTGMRTLWLDSVLQPVLDRSTRQIGAPAAWAKALTGRGVKVAVLDSGIDATHPDLADRVVEARNFTEEDSKDHVGHGTHVASTIAGTGAASGGLYRGVAPEATLLDGKVCGAAGCQMSAILAGVEWAAPQARVVNLSIGAPDQPGLDPLEQAIAALTEQYGTLFVIAAGNEGPVGQTITSPGSVAEALTVGAVDRSDVLAPFSSRGPGFGTGLKPDITAPDVDLVAARSAWSSIGTPIAERYVALSGTSMATPHVAGAAALLAQQHPAWKAPELKSTLMGSAAGSAAARVFERGSGRLDVAKATTQQLRASPPSVSFGVALWPSSDDPTLQATVTYSNEAAQPIELELTLEMVGPGGLPAPAGMFDLQPRRLTVPGGGTASARLTAATKVTSSTGHFTGIATATGGSTQVSTPVAVEKEAESYNLTLEHLGFSGQAPAALASSISGIDVDASAFLFGDGSVRLPRGTYLLNSYFEPTADEPRSQFVVHPSLQLTSNQTLKIDTHSSHRLKVSVPDATARPITFAIGTLMPLPRGPIGLGILGEGHLLDNLRTAHLGPAVDPSTLFSTLTVHWAKPDDRSGFNESPSFYDTVFSLQGRFFDGYRKDVQPEELREVRAVHALVGPEGSRAQKLMATMPENVPIGPISGISYALPFRRREYLYGEAARQPILSSDAEGPEGMSWMLAGHPWLTLSALPREDHFNEAAFGPALAGDPSAYRLASSLVFDVPLFTDAANHFNSTAMEKLDAYRATLYRNGSLHAETQEPLPTFDVPPEKATYRLELSAKRSTLPLSTSISASWTFTSKDAGAGPPQPLGLQAIRFRPILDSKNEALAPMSILAVDVEGQDTHTQAVQNRLSVEVSLDDGATWRRLALHRWRGRTYGLVIHPRRASYVSLRGKYRAPGGESVEQTILRAYRTR